MSKAWAKGSTTRWRKIRAQVLRRDQYLCQIKLPKVCTTRATCVHHVLSRAVSGDDPRYLVAACSSCNLKVGEPGRNQPRPKQVSKW